MVKERKDWYYVGDFDRNLIRSINERAGDL